ncbi:MAG: Hpt domain-containing protein, partial [Alphaproteobacteria bacterium]|nr:Hpt domain-containing protein [Alphaproteobacteria bacterium]
MKDRQSLVLREKLAGLSRAYLVRLSTTLAEARRIMASLGGDSVDDENFGELYRIFHNIKGGAASFGLMNIGSVGAEGVEIIARLQHLDSSSRQMAVTASVRALETCLVHLEALWQDATNVTSPDDRQSLPVLDSSGVPAIPLRASGRSVYLCDDDEL